MTARPGTAHLKIVEAAGDVPASAAAVSAHAREQGLVQVKREGWTAGAAQAEAAGFTAMDRPVADGAGDRGKGGGHGSQPPAGYVRWLDGARTGRVAEPPYYRQSTDFTCGAVVALVAQAGAEVVPRESLDRSAELTLWRDATNFPACEPVGLGVAVRRAAGFAGHGVPGRGPAGPARLLHRGGAGLARRPPGGLACGRGTDRGADRRVPAAGVRQRPRHNGRGGGGRFPQPRAHRRGAVANPRTGSGVPHSVLTDPPSPPGSADSPDSSDSPGSSASPGSPDSSAAVPTAAVPARPLRRVWSLLARHPRVLLAAAALPLLPGWLLRAYASITGLEGGRVVNGQIHSAVDAAPVGLLEWLTALVSVLGGAFSLGLTALVAAGLLLDRPVPFRAALRRLVARPWSLIGWSALTVLVTAAVFIVAVFGVVLSVMSMLSGASSLWGLLWFPALPLLFLLLIVLAAVAVAWPIALLEERPLDDAIALAWREGRERRGLHLLCVLLAVALVVAPVFAGRLASVAVEATGPALAIGFAVHGLLGFLLAPSAALLVCAPVLFGRGERSPGLDPERVRERLPGKEARKLSRLPGAAVVLVAVLTLPPLAGAGVQWSNPYGVPGSTVLSLPDMEGQLTRMSVEHEENGVRVELVQSAHPQTLVCDPDCTTSDDIKVRSSSMDMTDAQAAVAGGYAATQWRWRDDGVEAHSELELRVCRDTCADGAETTVIDTLSYDRAGTDPGRWGLMSAVAPVGDGLLIAAVDTPIGESVMTPPEEPMGLLAYHCPDLGCAAPDRVRLPDLPMSDQNASPYRYRLDLSAGDGGAYSVLFRDMKSGTTSLVTCPDLECAEPAARELPDLPGVRIAMRPDGVPVIAHLAERDRVRLLDCQDAGCADWETREIATTRTENAPGLAVDSLGRPQLAFPGPDGDSLTYAACADAACTEWESSVVFHREDVAQPYRFKEVQVTRLFLDGDDRPTLVFDHDLVRCTEPRCGLAG